MEETGSWWNVLAKPQSRKSLEAHGTPTVESSCLVWILALLLRWVDYRSSLSLFSHLCSGDTEKVLNNRLK